MRETFPMIPATQNSLLIMAPIAFILVGAVAFFLYFFWSARHTDFVVDRDEIVVTGFYYGRSIPMSDVIVDSIRIEDIHKPSPYALTRRTNGVGLPGYKAGWFRTANGEKALVYVTVKDRVVVIPTTAGYTLLASVANPEAFVTKVREMAGTGG
mgnify:CR=1 FL=1